MPRTVHPRRLRHGMRRFGGLRFAEIRPVADPCDLRSRKVPSTVEEVAQGGLKLAGIVRSQPVARDRNPDVAVCGKRDLGLGVSPAPQTRFPASRRCARIALEPAGIQMPSPLLRVERLRLEGARRRGGHPSSPTQDRIDAFCPVESIAPAGRLTFLSGHIEFYSKSGSLAVWMWAL